jgi:excisionase family DNA binding protein
VSAYLTVADVAGEVGVSMRTVLRWISAGELEALRLPGGRLRISQTAWTSFVSDHTTEARPRILADMEASEL